MRHVSVSCPAWPSRQGRLPVNHRPPLAYRLAEAAPPPAPAGPLARDPQTALLEAALLAADEPLPARKLALAAGLPDGGAARRLLKKLQDLYDKDATAFQVEEVAGGFQLLTRPEHHRWLVQLRRTGQDLRLSGASRETLAIVAYRQPVTRADVEEVRGVHCGDVLGHLMEKGLVRIAGRDPSLGRPVLYGTTRKFLQVFGLKGLKDLPQAEGLGPPRGPAVEEPGERGV